MANPYELDFQNYQTALEQFARPARQYKKDAAGYNTAVTDYQGKVNSYNTAATTFNDSFYRDANKAQAGLVGGQWTGNAPANKVGYGLYTDPTNSSQQFLRKPEPGAEQVKGKFVVRSLGGNGMQQPMPGVGIPGVGWMPIQQLLLKGYVMPDLTGVKQNQEVTLQKTNYTAAPVSPGEFTQKAPVAPVAPVAPEGTLNQMQGGPTASQALTGAERSGLLSDVIQGRGIR